MIYNNYEIGNNKSYDIKNKYGADTINVNRNYAKNYLTEHRLRMGEQYIQLNKKYVDKLKSREEKLAYMLVELAQSLLGYVGNTEVRRETIMNVPIIDKWFEKFDVNREKIMDIYTHISREDLSDRLTYSVDPLDDRIIYLHLKSCEWKTLNGVSKMEYHHINKDEVVLMEHYEHMLLHYNTLERMNIG